LKINSYYVELKQIWIACNMTGKKPGLSVDREADNTGMIVEVRGSKVILNKKQLAICFAPRKYETETVIRL